MAHLDLNDLNQANLQFLIQQVPPMLGQQINHPQIFVSLYDRPNGNPNNGGFRPATFARTLISTYYPGININPWNNQNQSLVQYLTNGIPAGHNIKVLNRNTAYRTPFIHPEIGLEIDPNLGLQTFGSIQGNEPVTLNHIATSRNQFVENINSPQANYNVLSERGRRNQIFSRIKAIPLKILRWLRLIQ